MQIDANERKEAKDCASLDVVVVVVVGVVAAVGVAERSQEMVVGVPRASFEYFEGQANGKVFSSNLVPEILQMLGLGGKAKRPWELSIFQKLKPKCKSELIHSFHHASLKIKDFNPAKIISHWIFSIEKSFKMIQIEKQDKIPLAALPCGLK